MKTLFLQNSFPGNEQAYYFHWQMLQGETPHNEKQAALLRIWQKCCYDQQTGEDTWHEDIRVLYALGAGMQETLKFLYQEKPGFDAFIAWTDQFRKAVTEHKDEDVLTQSDLDFWNANGYVVVKQSVTPQQCLDAQNAIWDFLGASIHDRESWYRAHPHKQGLMLLFTQHAALEANRNSERIRNAYRQLYGTRHIYKTIDKVSFNPPECENFRFMGSPLHWDVSLALPIPFGLQGLLYLSDVTEDGGAFHCVPGFHREIEDWLFNIPLARDARELAPQLLKPVPIAGQAGDFIIWHQALPHCASPNKSKVPRMVQYLTYLPEEYKSQDTWI